MKPKGATWIHLGASGGLKELQGPLGNQKKSYGVEWSQSEQKKAFGSQRELMGATETKEGHWETYCAIGSHKEPW